MGKIEAKISVAFPSLSAKGVSEKNLLIESATQDPHIKQRRRHTTRANEGKCKGSQLTFSLKHRELCVTRLLVARCKRVNACCREPTAFVCQGLVSESLVSPLNLAPRDKQSSPCLCSLRQDALPDSHATPVCSCGCRQRKGCREQERGSKM